MMHQVILPIPELLKEIYKAVHTSPPMGSNMDRLQPVWETHVELAKLKIPEIHVESKGEVLYLNDLSLGCWSCKEGTWDCIFTTMQCNLNCQFCLSPKAFPKDYAGSIFGTRPEEIAENHAKTRITGISFSGGEPFLETPRLFEWFAWLKKRYPDKYYWVYTNGLLTSKETLSRLGELGLDEIRFNMAATGYDHPTVMDNLALAVRYIPNVTVEIPAIPEHASKLLSCLAKWCELGVKFLNIHELIYEAGSNSESMPGSRRAVIFFDGHRCEINPDSRALTLTVMCKVHEENLPLAVNDCSMHSKVRQLRGRRKCIASLVKSNHENFIDGDFLEGYCCYQGDDVQFFLPDFLEEMRQQYPDYHFVRLIRTAPLSLKDPGRWISFEKL